MSRYIMVHCDYLYPDGDRCGLQSHLDLARGWQLGPPDRCPRHRTDRGPGTRDPIPLAA